MRLRGRRRIPARAWKREKNPMNFHCNFSFYILSLGAFFNDRFPEPGDDGLLPGCAPRGNRRRLHPGGSRIDTWHHRFFMDCGAVAEASSPETWSPPPSSIPAPKMLIYGNLMPEISSQCLPLNPRLIPRKKCIIRNLFSYTLVRNAFCFNLANDPDPSLGGWIRFVYKPT